VASSCVDPTLRRAIEAALGREPLRVLEQSPRAISAVLDPTGTPRGEPLCRDEGILYAEIDLAECVEPKQFHDVVGSYNRFDIFALSVDRSPRDPATFIDEARRPAGLKVPDTPPRAGRPRSRRERRRRAGLAAWLGRLFGHLDRHLGALATVPLVAIFLVSLLPALLLSRVCQEVSENDE
jgi:hypothetical protein